MTRARSTVQIGAVVVQRTHPEDWATGLPTNFEYYPKLYDVLLLPSDAPPAQSLMPGDPQARIISENISLLYFIHPVSNEQAVWTFATAAAAKGLDPSEQVLTAFPGVKVRADGLKFITPIHLV